jgi:RNA polymerase sigma-70 factor (ECF subfamily)
LHARVLVRHPGALDCLDLVFLKALPQRLARAFPRVPWDFTVDAATDACLEYGANPARFDTSRGSLIDYVYLIARRNLANRLRAESARKARETRYASEQPCYFSPDISSGRSDICLWEAVSAVIIDSRERRAMEQWLDAASDDAIAEALGVGHLAPEDRRREIRRFKDRLLKRLSRYFRPLPGRA